VKVRDAELRVQRVKKKQVSRLKVRTWILGLGVKGLYRVEG
jgi:hypothetical protein